MKNRVPARLLASGLLIAGFLCAANLCLASNEKGKSAAAFEQLFSLVGEWEGMNSAGPVKATYTLVSGGTALLERLKSANEPEMLTLYTLDGDHLNVTHYCSAGNQPQMKTAVITEIGAPLTFKVVQVMGLKSPDDGHMTGLIVTMPDRDHFTQQWTYKEKGKEQTDVFKFTRKS